jgi:putative transposase
MVKSSSVIGATVKNNPERRETLADLLELHWENALVGAVGDVIIEFGKLALELLQDKEIRELVGRRYVHNTDRELVRWGKSESFAYVNGQKVPLDKKRVRSLATADTESGEVKLKTHKLFTNPKAMDEQIIASLLSGVSTRDYPNIVEKTVRGRGISKSTISRKGIEATAQMLKDFLTKRLDNLTLVAVFMDGIQLGERHNIVAIGMDTTGKKHVLGIKDGSSENSSVCKELLVDICERGISIDRKYLFVLDGAKALSAAVEEMFPTSPIQRCQIHKARNVADKLPEEHKEHIMLKLKVAYSQETFAKAEKALQAVLKEVSMISSKAASSLLEGMPETLTVHKLGITGVLRKSVSNTNIIESAFSTAKKHTRNVKRWKNDDQIERWLVRGVVYAENKFRKVRGYSQISKPRNALDKYVPGALKIEKSQKKIKKSKK